MCASLIGCERSRKAKSAYEATLSPDVGSWQLDRQARQARGHWFEPSTAHSRKALLGGAFVFSVENTRRARVHEMCTPVAEFVRADNEPRRDTRETVEVERSPGRRRRFDTTHRRSLRSPGGAPFVRGGHGEGCCSNQLPAQDFAARPRHRALLCPG
jgi:hypothetical protein